MVKWNFIFCIVLFLSSSFHLFSQTYAQGNYTGNGSSKVISGLGFQPECVIIKSAGAYEAVITTANMPAGKSKAMGTSGVALATEQISSLNADGFTIGAGTSTNNNNTQYYWIAFNESTGIHVGTYVGDGPGNPETISGCGFIPDAYILMGDETSTDGNAQINLNSLSASGNGFYIFDGAVASGTFSAWTADGWTTLGGATSADNSGVNYYYIAFDANSNIKQGSYPSLSEAQTDNYAVNDIGFQPDFLIAYPYVSTPRTPVFRMGSINSGDDKSLLFTATASSTNLIQAFTANGFTAGNDDRVHKAWQTQHYYFALKGGSALPVDLTEFEVSKHGEQALIEWSTATEINSDYYEVLRSPNGINFKSIGRIEAANNSTQIQNYSFTDEHPLEGINYYRLAEIDNGGRYEKFKIKSLTFNFANIITDFFPNPVNNNVTLLFNSYSDENYDLQISDLLGRTLYSLQTQAVKGINQLNLTTNNLSAGIYFINLTDTNNHVSSMKFMKSEY